MTAARVRPPVAHPGKAVPEVIVGAGNLNHKLMFYHSIFQWAYYILYKELGPVEARRFMALTHPVRREDSIKRYRRWQANLHKKGLLVEIKVAHEKARKR